MPAVTLISQTRITFAQGRAELGSVGGVKSGGVYEKVCGLKLLNSRLSNTCTLVGAPNLADGRLTGGSAVMGLPDPIGLPAERGFQKPKDIKTRRPVDHVLRLRQIITSIPLSLRFLIDIARGVDIFLALPGGTRPHDVTTRDFQSSLKVGMSSSSSERT